jgi:predicted acyltransferase
MTAISKRLLSLDALRGFDMFWIISGEGIFHALANAVMTRHSLIRNTHDWTIATKGDLSFLERISIVISNQLHHTIWNGFTFYDMIFPLFIFISGVSMPFSYYKYFSQPDSSDKISTKKKLYIALVKRTLILIILGMVVNGLLKFQGYENTRFASVLGRIGLATFFAALIYLNSSLRWQIVWFILILTGYCAAMLLIPIPGYGAGNLSPEGNLSAYIDQLFLPGKLHNTIYDPEGLLSTIPAIASAMMGIFTGQFLKWQPGSLNAKQKTGILIASGIILLILGLGWNLFFPINKKMWTSSFVLFSGGWSVLLLAIFYFVIDVKGYHKWCLPFVWIGTNSILIYMAAHGLVNFESTAQFLFGVLISKLPTSYQDALLWTGILVIQLKLLQILYNKKLFLKI